MIHRHVCVCVNFAYSKAKWISRKHKIIAAIAQSLTHGPRTVLELFHLCSAFLKAFWSTHHCSCQVMLPNLIHIPFLSRLFSLQPAKRTVSIFSSFRLCDGNTHPDFIPWNNVWPYCQGTTLTTVISIKFLFRWYRGTQRAVCKQHVQLVSDGAAWGWCRCRQRKWTDLRGSICSSFVWNRAPADSVPLTQTWQRQAPSTAEARRTSSLKRSRFSYLWEFWALSAVWWERRSFPQIPVLWWISCYKSSFSCALQPGTHCWPPSSSSRQSLANLSSLFKGKNQKYTGHTCIK